MAFEKIKSNVSGWQSQIKHQRQLQSQDFRDSTKRQLKQINEDEKFQKNAILSKIEQKANELNLNTEDQVVQHE